MSKASPTASTPELIGATSSVAPCRNARCVSAGSPQVGADQQPQPPVGVDLVRVHEPALRVVFRLDQLAIRGQVDLAVDVNQLAVLVDARRIVELRAGTFLDKADDQDRVPGGARQLQQPRIAAVHGHVQQVFRAVMADHAEFGKHQKVGLCAFAASIHL
ncbi:MAG: hypothetical protein R8G60_08160 [Roseovarius pacificus]|nr:hypothetical protein [Roseovarius pacificus]